MTKPVHNQPSASVPNMPSMLVLTLSLLTLNAFAIAQPVFDRLAANVQYLVLENFDGGPVVALIVLMLTALPLGLATVIFSLRCLKLPRAARGAATISILLLSVLGMLVVMRWLSRTTGLLDLGVPDSWLGVVAIIAGIGVTWLYARAEWYRQLLCVSACGCLLFPVQLLRVPAILEIITGTASAPIGPMVKATDPAPVMMIVFDGFCGMALLNENHEIDRMRYPGFGRLSDMSTFYRNATTVHTRTDRAVPAILSGRMPKETAQPVEVDYPDALFRQIYDTQQFDMTIFEPVTRLAPTELRQLVQARTAFDQVLTLLDVSTRVFVNVSLPQDLDSLSVRIPRTWFGIIDRRAGVRSPEKRLVLYGMDTNREVQCAHFRDLLIKTEKPGFRFLHVVVPHDPFSILPSGKTISIQSNIADKLYGADLEDWVDDEWPVHRAWQRYLLQLQFADRALGLFLDQLETTGQLNDALIVVTGDHGLSFVANQSRRSPVSSTLPGIVSVPLFIKRPGQNTGRVSDRNVETIDILPTIADELGLPTDSTWDGQSLFDESLPQRPRKTVRGAVDTVLEPDFPQRFEYVDRMLALFGSGSRDDRLTKLNLEPELIGVSLSEVARGSASELSTHLFFGGDTISDEYPEVVPCYLHGQLLNADDDNDVHRIAVALNGTILATTRTSIATRCHQEWAAMLPESAYRFGKNDLRMFELTGTGVDLRLHEITFQRDGD